MKLLLAVSLLLLVLSMNAKDIRVALVGSSACESYGKKDPKLIFGWGEVIGDFFTPDVKIMNFAKSGRSSKSFQAEGRWDKVIAAKPDYILMTIGANDAKIKDPKRYTNPETEYRANLMKFLSDSQKIGAKMIFVTINQALCYDKKTNRAVFNSDGKVFRKDREPYNKVIREVAAKTGTPCLELAKAQSKKLEDMGEAEAGKLYRIIPKTGKVDPSHTNLSGAKLIAGIIVEELAKSNSPLKKYIAKKTENNQKK